MYFFTTATEDLIKCFLSLQCRPFFRTKSLLFLKLTDVQYLREIFFLCRAQMNLSGPSTNLLSHKAGDFTVRTSERSLSKHQRSTAECWIYFFLSSLTLCCNHSILTLKRMGWGRCTDLSHLAKLPFLFKIRKVCSLCLQGIFRNILNLCWNIPPWNAL